MTTPWLTLVGMGEDGVEGLTPAARAVVAGARVLVGSRRLLDKVPDDGRAERIVWTTLDDTLAAILARRSEAVVVLATGDPMHFGLGATLSRHVEPGAMTVLPHPGAFSLAAARLGWPLQDVVCLSAHGRPVEALALHFAPGRRLLVLSSGTETVSALTRLLTREGYGPSGLTVLAHMGGAEERRLSGTADTWREPVPDLSTIAVECRLAPGAVPRSQAPGLPDDAFEHDGQITKSEARAVTVAALAPWPGALLWDIGAGSGAVAIEWLRAVPGTRAVAVEKDTERLARIGRNAVALGVPHLEAVQGEAPVCLATLPGPAPDAVFVGGGVSAAGVLEGGWQHLRSGGRLVANAVTVEAEACLGAFRQTHGGTLTRLSVARLKPVGRLTAWDPMAPLTQLVAVKP